ncbi:MULTISPECIES: ATP-dependent zinc metalloprotease FtsH [environmental samples]|uniref:ATP-dependent zinc metalloprotease FtsH n=1 Tax=environmental samples TaxID=134245 RepID=UPI00033F588D|nr:MULTISPECIES: ATP-dependent zinc metalloprotease FtsH [environmental samples]CCY09199.1 aTP-dependent zinc metalloprotease FtsH [Porphyromonas sp. CAG:1061]
MALQQNNPKNSPNRKKKKGFGLGWVYTLMLLSILGILLFSNGSSGEEVEWSRFQAMLQDDLFEEVTVYSSKGTVHAVVKKEAESKAKKYQIASKEKDQKRPSLLSKIEVTSEIPGAGAFNDLYQEIMAGKKPISAKVSYVNNTANLLNIIISFLPLLIIIFFWVWMSRRMMGNMGGGSGGSGGGIFNVGKSKAQLFDAENRVKVTFKDVAGLSGAKQEVEEIVHFLKEPQKYTELGGKIPKGALLVGPPGTGKTLLAKAVAGEAGVPFFSLSGSDFVEMFVGVGASRVRDLFKTAKEKSPSIIFIDEIDAIGRARSKNAGFSGNDERENTLNQLLTEMDGFGTNSGVIILAATNRVDILDKALLRAGRFDRQISVELPDVHERKEIFQVHMRPLKMDDTVDIDLLSRQTPGFSGADIANVCNEAALHAARANKSVIQGSDFMSAIDRIVGGLEKKTKITTEEEKRAIAIHEAGHATVSWLLEHANPLIKVTIVPRGRSLGAAWYLPEERQITTTEQLLDEMCATLGGRAAEFVTYGKISTGAANDLMKVTRMAQAMVTYFGMSEKLPNINYEDNQNEYGFTKPYSEATAKMIDEEVLQIINTQYERAKQILMEHRDGHQKIADLLFSREVIFTEDVEKILGKRPWKSRADQLLDAENKSKEQESTIETPTEATEKE